MKKYNILFFTFGALLSIVPIYSSLAWIYVCIIYPDLTQAETVKIYDAQFSFNLFENRYYDSFFVVFCGLFSCGLLYLSFLISIHEKKNLFKTIKTILLYTSAIFTFWKIFGLM